MMPTVGDKRLQILLVAACAAEAERIQSALAAIQDPSCRVHAEESLARGLEALAEGPFDVVLLDLFLPDS
ncbi:MAG: hypothetical protein WAU91_02110, partial [Desulfatitalea sp.]